jgi:hypothetical protein
MAEAEKPRIVGLNVFRVMGLNHLAKNEKAKKELAEKGMGV